MDKLDNQILSYLYKDSQMSFGKIAKKLGTSTYTIRLRYRKMKKRGIIPFNFIRIDLSKLGYQGFARFFIILTPNKEKIVTVLKIFQIRNIFSVIELVGPYDILASAPITNLNSIRKILSKIKKLPEVQRVKMAITNNTEFPINLKYGEILSRKILE